MSLTNAQYDEIMRKYEERRFLHASILKDRQEEVYKKIPEYGAIDEEIANLSMDFFRTQLTPEKMSRDEYHEKMDALISKKPLLLKQAGFPEDYLAPIYDCPDCRDTGYIDNKPCHCFQQASIDLLYFQTHLQDVFEKENFDSFSLDFYSDEYIDPATNKSSLANAKEVLEYAHSFVSNFPSDGGNIFLYGETGLGKTFLTNCIAKALLDQNVSVLYLTSFELVNIFEKKIKDKSDAAYSDYNHVFDVDLLIIDDLGTEMPNSFTKSNLFEVINDRLLHNRSTVISSNLSMRDIKENYSERIASRIVDRYKILRLFGTDIRTQKIL